MRSTLFPCYAPDSHHSDPLGPASAPVFDRAGALQGYGGDLRLLRELLAIFDESLGSRIDDLLSAIKSGDLALIASLGHSLKGSSAFVYAIRLSALCGEIEAAARSGELETINALGARLPSEAAALRDAVSGI